MALTTEDVGSDHLVLPIILSSSTTSVQTYALADSGGSAIAFMDGRFAALHQFLLIPLGRSLILNVVDGRTIASGQITHYVEVPMRIANHVELVPFLITVLGHYPVVLGIKWLQRHDVTTRWGANMVLLNSPYCKDNCLELGRPAIVHGLVEVPDVPPHLNQDNLKDQIDLDSDISNINKPGPHRKPSRTHKVQRAKRKCQVENPITVKHSAKQVPVLVDPKTLDICMIGAAAYAMYSKKKDYQLFAISLRDIDKALEEKSRPDPSILLPEEYHDFFDVFSRTESDKLPPHRQYDYNIPLIPGKEPPSLPLRNQSQDELRVIKKYLEDNLSKSWIRASRSPAAAPVLLVKKPGGGIRFCVDYRGLNDITVKNRYPLSLIRETLDRLS